LPGAVLSRIASALVCIEGLEDSQAQNAFCGDEAVRKIPQHRSHGRTTINASSCSDPENNRPAPSPPAECNREIEQKKYRNSIFSVLLEILLDAMCIEPELPPEVRKLSDR
jgi:hypothetical protein